MIYLRLLMDETHLSFVEENVLLFLRRPVMPKYLRFWIHFGPPQKVSIKHLSPHDQVFYISFSDASWEWIIHLHEGSKASRFMREMLVNYCLHQAFVIPNTSIKSVLSFTELNFDCFLLGLEALRGSKC